MIFTDRLHQCLQRRSPNTVIQKIQALDEEPIWDAYGIFLASPSGKMILLTKKKMTMDMPPLRTVVPML